jgi:regulatory protein
MAQPRLSLRAQAVAWLAQREHSELELRRKLTRRLHAEHSAVADGDSSNSPAGDAGAEVDAVVTWLIERGYLNEQRFIASRLHLRSGRHGVRRIEQELARHGLSLPADDAKALRLGEFDQALALWQRRFGAPPADAREAARQARFLAGRGFSAEVVRRVLRQAGPAPSSTAGDPGDARPVEGGRRWPRTAHPHDDTTP